MNGCASVKKDNKGYFFVQPNLFPFPHINTIDNSMAISSTFRYEDTGNVYNKNKRWFSLF